MCSLALERLGTDAKHEARRSELIALRLRLETPIAKIPVELLLMVFEIVGRPVVISHVCQRWRQVALSQPTLWRSLVLTGLPKKALRKVREWRKRSCGRIAELIIRKSLGGVIIPYDRLRAVHPDDVVMRDHILAELRSLDLAFVKACHLEDVDVAQFLAALEGDANHIGPLGMHHLETLSSSQSYPIGPIFLGSKEYATQSWKNLRALTINNMGCDWKTLTDLVHGLTSFEYRVSDFSITFDCVRLVLQANPELEKVVIEAIPTSIPLVFEPTETFTSANLRHLELDGVILLHHSTQSLSLPSLQVLRLSRTPGTEGMLRCLAEDPGTSFAGLVELTLKSCFLEAQFLISMLSQAPKLKILQLTGDFGVNDVAASLSIPCKPLLRIPISMSVEPVPIELPVLCPALSVLDLSGSPKLTTSPLMRIVKERIALANSDDGGRYWLPGEDDDQRVSCIQVLKVDECPQIEAEILPWFRKNVPTFSCRYFTKNKKSRV
jgi:F-box/TPR repeat protein Pof3